MVLRGVNARIEGVFDVTFDDGRVPLETVPPFTGDDAVQMREFGFDSLRLPVNWSGVEPTEDGGFDAAYVQRVFDVVDAARGAGLLVLIDFHQDAYSKEIGEDGAPLWAIIPAPTPDQLLEGPLTDLAERRQSEPVLAAFDTFFGDSDDGTWLRDRFIAMVKHVAEAFATDEAVIGFEIFNEPLADTEGLRRLHEPALEAVRQVAPKKLFVFEPGTIRNFTDSAPVAEAPMGVQGAGTVYAPHIYTYAFTSTDEQKQSMTKDQLRRSHDNALVEAESWNAHLMVTEWGFDPNGIKGSEYLTWQTEHLELDQASSFFWLWKEESQGRWGCFDYDEPSGSWSPRLELKKVLGRVRPFAVAGWPESYAFDRTTGRFELAFVSDPAIQGPTVIAVAPVLGPVTQVTCDGSEVGGQPDGYGMMDVPCGDGDGARHVIQVFVNPE